MNLSSFADLLVGFVGMFVAVIALGILRRLLDWAFDDEPPTKDQP